MSSGHNNVAGMHDERDLIEISQLIDLTDKPIGLTRDEISWSRVRSNASNCICCCCNNSITLVTTDDSYVLDHVPLDNIQFAQANPSLQYLALSNHRSIAVIDLVDYDIKCGFTASAKKEDKIINMAAQGLTMSDIIYWRWIGDSVLAILSYEALYTCSVNQPHISHPAHTALVNRSKHLSMQKEFALDQHLSVLCQVTDIQWNYSETIFAISGLYSAGNFIKLDSTITDTHTNKQSTSQSQHMGASSTLRPSFGSVPSRLSQLVNNDRSFENVRQDHSTLDRPKAYSSRSPNEDEICGLVQVHCKMRDRSQLIQAHAITFTSADSPISYPLDRSDLSHSDQSVSRKSASILVAANRIGEQMRVYFIEMATPLTSLSTGQNASTTTKFENYITVDFPSSIVCSHIEPNSRCHLHVALITTKYGQLYVCSVKHSTILFNTSLTTDIISSAVLERRTKGLMVICRNGQVLLVKLNLDNLMRLFEESKTLRHISTSQDVLGLIGVTGPKMSEDQQVSVVISQQPATSVLNDQLEQAHDADLEVLISTKL